MKVAIIHPWLPQYRLRFFERLLLCGKSRGIDFHVYYGETSPEWRARNDATESPDFFKLPTRFLNLGRRSLNYKSLTKLRASGPYDLIIVEQAVRNLETYQLMLKRTPLAFWGHGRTYTKRSGLLQEQFKHFLTKRGVWFFAYTQGGVESVASIGYPRNSITLVQNSIDSQDLATAVASVTDQDRHAFEELYGLKGKTAMFIGGLDESKRLPFLLSAAEKAYQVDPDFRLLIAGDGAIRKDIQKVADESLCIDYLGPLFGKDKAVALASAQVLAMPGRVGLVAVDSFAALTPIVTTRWTWHAPEFEYLGNNYNSVITADDVDSYSSVLLDTLCNGEELARLRQGCLESSTRYTVEVMVENFVEGVIKALDVVK